MADWGLKVSRSSVDAGTATVLDLVFSSQYDSLKVFSNGVGTITVPARTGTAPPFTVGSATGTVTHNLGYHPAFFCLTSNINRGTDITKISPYGFLAVGALSPSREHYSVGTGNLLITSYNGGTAQRDVIFRYQIFHNRLK